MKCFLDSNDPSLPSVDLDNKFMKIVGRSRLTGIKDVRVSKQQVEVTPSFQDGTVSIKQTGPNYSALNGKPIRMGLTVTAKHGDMLQLYMTPDEKQRLYTYQVKFESEDTDVETLPTRKRKTEPSSVDEKPTKMAIVGSAKIADQFRKQTLPTGGTWESLSDEDFFVYAFGEDLDEPKPCIGSFDLDGTIIKTKSGRVFPKDENDWTFLLNSVTTKLQSFFSTNLEFKFVIFTNQAGIKKPGDLPPFKRKIENIIRQIGIPVLVFISTKKNKYRKPMTGGWDRYVQQFNGGMHPDLERSFFCGDAAGRHKDHSKGDRLFALNIGLGFKIPEEFFQSTRPPLSYPPAMFCPKDFLDGLALTQSNSHISFPQSQEMVVMVGFPASGKSSYVKSALLPNGYVHINRDLMKTIPKCVEAAGVALSSGKSVVIDNTNPSIKDREVFIKLAKQKHVPVRCLRVMVDHIQALHNNLFRFLAGDLETSIPDVAFNTFKSTFQEPVKAEGFDEVLSVYFVPEFHENEERELLYRKYLLDK